MKNLERMLRNRRKERSHFVILIAVHQVRDFRTVFRLVNSETRTANQRMRSCHVIATECNNWSWTCLRIKKLPIIAFNDEIPWSKDAANLCLKGRGREGELRWTRKNRWSDKGTIQILPRMALCVMNELIECLREVNVSPERKNAIESQKSRDRIM